MADPDRPVEVLRIVHPRAAAILATFTAGQLFELNGQEFVAMHVGTEALLLVPVCEKEAETCGSLVCDSVN